MNKREVGSRYEELVVHYLIEHGYRILERNYRTKQGEIDIIAKDGKYLVFLEVKYRKNEKLGYPSEAVSYAKQRRISRVALGYMNHHRYSIYDTPVRFDVAAILDGELEYIKNAFDYVP